MNIENKKQINEKKFPNFENLRDGGRRYWLEVKGKHSWKARYIKEVDVFEETVRFYQEIYDGADNLIEVHEKFPSDKGHRMVKEE